MELALLGLGGYKHVSSIRDPSYPAEPFMEFLYVLFVHNFAYKRTIVCTCVYAHVMCVRVCTRM